jgi:hypothetical protein
MPIACNPRHTTWFSLTVDQPEPEESRPAFRARFLTADQVMEVRQLIVDASNEGTDAKAKPILAQAIAKGVTGWRNMRDPDGNPVDFSIDSLSRVLTVLEMYEVAGAQIDATGMREADAKKSVSPSASHTENSAPSAALPASAPNA